MGVPTRFWLLTLALLLAAAAAFDRLDAANAHGIPPFSPVVKVRIAPERPYPASGAIIADEVAVNQSTGQVYVAGSDGSVSILDPRAGGLVKTARFDLSLRLGGRLAVDSQRNLVYAMAGGAGGSPVELLALDGTTLQEVRRLRAPEEGSLRGVLIDFERARLYVVYWVQPAGVTAARLTLLDMETGRVLAGIGVKAASFDLALDGTRGVLYVLDRDSFGREFSIKKVRADTLEDVAEYRLPFSPTAMALGPTGERLYLADADKGLLAMDAFSGATVVRRPTPVTVGGVLVDESRGRLLVPMGTLDGGAKLSAFSLDDLAPLGELELAGGWPARNGAALDETRHLLFVAQTDGTVSVIDLVRWATDGRVAVSPRIAGLAYEPALRRAFLTSENEGKLLAVDLPAGQTKSVALGAGLSAIALDPARRLVYVLSDRGRQVAVVNASSLKIERLVQVAADRPASLLALDSQRNLLYVAPADGLLKAIDPESGAVLSAHRKDYDAGYLALAVDEKTGDLYALSRSDGAERFKGRDLAPLGKLAVYGRALALDPDARRAYVGVVCEAKSCGRRTEVYNLDSGRLLATLEDVYGIAGANPSLGHLYVGAWQAPGITVVDQRTFDRATTGALAHLLAVDRTTNDVLALNAQEGTLTLYRDSLALSNPETARLGSARIEILWPHGGARTQDADRANLAAMVFEPGTLDPVDEAFRERLELWVSVNNTPARQLATGTRRSALGGYPIWDFNDIDVSPSRHEETPMMFFLRSPDDAVSSGVWSHGVDGRTRFPRPPTPTGLSPAREVDTLIRVVWPHDGQGAQAGVLEADYANISVSVFAHGTDLSVHPDWDGKVKLYRALNNGTLQLVGAGTKRLVDDGALAYPVWEFNDVDVSQARDPQTKYYFLASVEGVTSYPSVWSHGFDARTILPRPDFPLN